MWVGWETSVYPDCMYGGRPTACGKKELFRVAEEEAQLIPG